MIRVTKEEVVAYARHIVLKSDNPYKQRWLNAIESSKNIFLSNDHVVIEDLHNRINQYQTTIHTCGCKAASTGSPCYHRAYVLLQLRYAEMNGMQL